MQLLVFSCGEGLSFKNFILTARNKLRKKNEQFTEMSQAILFCAFVLCS